MGAIGLGLSLRQSGSFSPRRLFRSGEAGAWYDPSDLGSMSQNADGSGAAAVDAPVGRIADKSGRGNHAVQAQASARPMLRLDGGGRPYLEFDGVDDHLSASFAIAQPWDRVSAIRQLGWADLDRVLGTPATTAGRLLQTGTAPGLHIHSGSIVGLTPALPLGVNGVVTERHHGAASRVALNNHDYSAGDAGTAAATGLTLAASAAGVGPGHVRLYGVVMIGRALSAAETMRLRRFMAARAGVAL